MLKWRAPPGINGNLRLRWATGGKSCRRRLAWLWALTLFFPKLDRPASLLPSSSCQRKRIRSRKRTELIR